MATYSVVLYLALALVVCIASVLRVERLSRRSRIPRLRSRVFVGAALFLVIIPIAAPAFPNAPALVAQPADASEVVSSPEYVDAAVMPDGNVGMIFVDGAAPDTRFKRYFVEQGMDPSVELVTSSAEYPQLASFKGQVIAAYVDNRSGSPTQWQLRFRVSPDSGTTWGAEYSPFGSETFAAAGSAPLLIASHDGATLYLFTCCVSSLPQYRSTTDPLLVTWTTAAAAGDASMVLVTADNCAGAGQECARSHSFEFTETATPGHWLYIARSAAGASSRGTQAGILGGAWSAQFDQGGSGESRATAFIDRNGTLFYLRADGLGQSLYYKASNDLGATWGSSVQAYTAALSPYTTAGAIGLYVPGYTRGEYLWYAGFGGVGGGNDQNAVRVIPLWRAASSYAGGGTTRLFGSLGGDFDFGTAYPYTLGSRDIPTGIGAYKTSAEDLALPGRLLNFSFSRSYNSVDTSVGPLGPGWTHSFNWSLVDSGSQVEIRRGDGRRDLFVRNPDGTYAAPTNVFDVLSKNPDASFTLILKNQTQYEFLGSTDVALGKPILFCTDAHAGFPCTNAIDGNDATQYIDNGGPEHDIITLDLQSPLAVNGWYTRTTNEGTYSGVPWWCKHNARSSFLMYSDNGIDFTLATGSSYYGTRDQLTNQPLGGNAFCVHSGSVGSVGQEYGVFPSAGAHRYWQFHAFRTACSCAEILDTLRLYTDADAPIGARPIPLTRIHEPAGNQIALGYTSGHLATVTDTVGRSITLGYTTGSFGERLASVQDPTGRKVTYGYDTSGRLTTVVDKIGNAAGQDPNLHTWDYSYDGASAHIATVVDPDGRIRVTNTYNSEGRLATQADGAGNPASVFGYTPSQTTITDPRGHVTTQTFDSRWHLRTQSDAVVDVYGNPHTYTLEYRYEDTWQNLTAVIDRNGKETDYTYDGRGNVKTTLDPQVPPAERYLTQYDYDAKNNLTKITDARNFVTTLDYDPLTNVKIKTSQQIDTLVPPTNAITKWEYTAPLNPGLPTKIISPRGNTGPTPNYTYSQTLAYDSQGNLWTRTDADGNLTRFCYEDGLGRLTSMVDADGNAACGVTSPHTWKTFYDENDRVTEQRDPLVHSAFTGYDGAGNRTSATDRNGNITTYAYDGAARLANVKQKPDQVKIYTTTVTRDANGNATGVSQDNQSAAGNITVVTDYGFDAMNRMITTTTHPSVSTSLTTKYLLDGNGNSLSRETGDHVVTTYIYDSLSRLSTVSATNLATITYGYDGLSHRTSMSDGTGNSSYVYDGLGRLTSAVQPNGTLGYGYDLDSNRTTLTYPTVGNVTYIFSNAGRLNIVRDWASRDSTYTYFASGLTHTVSVLGGQMTTTYTYDNAQHLATLVNSTASGTVTSDSYTLDNEGNRIGIDELMPAVAAASAKINDDTGTAVQDHPALALGTETPNPASYLVWDDQRVGSTNSNVYFSRRDPATGIWSANVLVNTDATTRNQLNPGISVDSTNKAYVVWQDDRLGASNKIDTNIYSRKRSAAGVWDTGADVKVNDDATGNPVQRNPRIAGTAAGAETAVWVDFRSSQLNIYSSTLAVNGSAWAANKKVTDNTSSTVAKDFPDVAVGADGTSYAVWQDSRNGNADIFFSSLTSGGLNWAANVKISDDTGTTAQTKPRIGVDGSSNLIAAWIDARTAPAHVRVARRPSGGAWSASADISPTPANVQSLSLSVRADGFAWLTWGDTRAGSTNQDIWGSRYDPTLNAWSPPVRLDDDPGTSANQSAPAVAIGPSEVQLGWRDNRLSANGDIQARRLQIVAGLSDHFTLSYDGLSRLTVVTGPLNANNESFALDGASNITSRTGPAQTDTYDQSNRLTSDGTLSYTWSDADRLTNRGGDTLGPWDPLDRLTGSTVAGSARTYAYDGDGLLQSRTGSGATSLLWDASTSPSRLLVSGSDRIVYGLGPLYSVNGVTVTTYARDGQQSIRAELNGTTVTSSWRYRAYGQIVQSVGAASPSILGYGGQLLDPSGLYYMRARWYDVTEARFVSRDPLGPSSTTSTFGYAAGNPVRFADPTGMATTEGSQAAGACMDISCRRQVPYSDATVLAAAAAHEPIASAAIDLLTRGDVTPTYTFPSPPVGECASNCVRLEDGVAIFEQATGPLAWVVNALNNGGPGQVTFGPSLIVSTGIMPRGTEIYRHEFGHINEARRLGPLYLPTYAAEAFYQYLHYGDSYRYNAMEIGANRYAHLPDDWHVNH